MAEFEDTGEGAVNDFDSGGKDDVQLVDEDTVIFSKEEKFSHIQLVMSAYAKCIDAGCLEKIKGFWEEKTDKFGNMMKVYHADTRLVFIECIKTLKIVMASDMDNKCRIEINDCLHAIESFKRDMILAEEKWFQQQPYNTKQRIVHIPNHLNQDSMYYHAFINFQVEMYGKIFEELELMLKRTNYLKKKAITN